MANHDTAVSSRHAGDRELHTGADNKPWCVDVWCIDCMLLHWLLS